MELDVGRATSTADAGPNNICSIHGAHRGPVCPACSTLQAVPAGGAFIHGVDCGCEHPHAHVNTAAAATWLLTTAPPTASATPEPRPRDGSRSDKTY